MGVAPRCQGLGVETGTVAWMVALPSEDGVLKHRDPRAKDAGGTSTTRAESKLDPNSQKGELDSQGS